MAAVIRAKADIDAARELLGGGAPSARDVRGLPGESMCPHALAGNGEPIDVVFADHPDPKPEIREFRDHARQIFERAPYRHHDYVLNPKFEKDPSLFCYCGNPKIAVIHQQCWKEN